MNWLLSWVGKLLAGAAALGGLIFYASRQGRKAEQAEQTSKALEQSKERREIDNSVRTTSGDDLDQRVRRYQRD